MTVLVRKRTVIVVIDNTIFLIRQRDEQSRMVNRCGADFSSASRVSRHRYAHAGGHAVFSCCGKAIVVTQVKELSTQLNVIESVMAAAEKSPIKTRLSRCKLTRFRLGVPTNVGALVTLRQRTEAESHTGIAKPGK